MFDGLLPNAFAEFETVGRLLEAHDWIFAKTMPDNPHEYTLRKRWSDQEAFDYAVTGIRNLGYKAKFNGRTYIQLDVNDHYYWTMGAPLPSTILINRKERQPDTHPAPYDAAADGYDAAFATPACTRENEALLARIGDLSRLSVLDVGCGTGMLLDHAAPQRYLGIDPSQAMLARLHAKHPVSERVRTLNTPLKAFVGERYDLITALFGTASYFSDTELARVPALLNPGGRAILMFYAPDYIPVTHRELGVTDAEIRPVPSYCSAIRFGNYDLVEWAAA